MRITAIVQARMSSARFPGKMMSMAQGRPMLEYVLDRVRACRGLDKIVVATSLERSDDAIAAYCADKKQLCHRGPLEDVASRFSGAISRYGIEAFLRVNGDSPMMDPVLLETAIYLHGKTGKPMVTNVQKRTFPKGQSVELMRSDAFLQGERSMTDPEDREHVTRYFYKNPPSGGIHNFESVSGDHSRYDLSVDTPEDFRVFARIVEASGRHFPSKTWMDLVEMKKQLSGKEAMA